MLKNYFNTAVRNLLHNKVYSFINIIGLSLGLSCAMLILLYIKDEVSYDRFHKNVSRIYRIDRQSDRSEGNTHNSGYTGYFPGPRFAAKIPAIQSYTRFQPAQVDIRTGIEIHSQSVSLVDPNFFSVFSFPLVSGNPNTVLQQPNAIVISEDIAKKEFGSSQAVGKVIEVNEDGHFVPYMVSGVAKNCPQNSSVKFEVLLPLKISRETENRNDNWFNFFLTTFVVLSPDANIQATENKMLDVFEKDASESIQMIKKKYGVKDIGMSYVLEPITSIHLGKMVDAADDALADTSKPVFSYILSAIALFILLIACINFVNLTIARSVKRAKEIGIRKVIGGTRKQLIIQFLSESFILCLIAFGLAIFLLVSILPIFNQLSNKALSVSFLADTRTVIGFIIIFILTSLLAGFYPAAVLSGYDPVQTLYSRFNLAGKNYLQKSLVIFQFALASFMIIATMTIYLQFNFLTTQKMGYDDSNLMTVQKPNLTRGEAALLRHELLQNPNVMGVASKNSGFSNNTVSVNDHQQINISVTTIDVAFLPLLKIPIVQGRNFSDNFPTDSLRSVLVNETFASEAGWKQPIGQKVTMFDGNEDYTVVGVVKDYHYRPLTEIIKPQIFTMKFANPYGMAYIKLKPGNTKANLDFVEKTFRKLFPLTAFAYNFIDQQNEASYRAEEKWKQILLFSALLTIFISCIGLFGLSVLSAEKRTKEIGVRKVLGASVSNIATALSIDFLKLICIALIISIPVAWMTTSKWLQNYPYRISPNGWLFVAAGLLVILLALVTVSFQAVKAALANPVESLRAE